LRIFATLMSERGVPWSWIEQWRDPNPRLMNGQVVQLHMDSVGEIEATYDAASGQLARDGIAMGTPLQWALPLSGNNGLLDKEEHALYVL
jgi:hypothetical protein